MKIEEIRPKKFLENQKKAYLEDVEFYRNESHKFIPRKCPGCNTSQGVYFCNHFEFVFNRCPACYSIFMTPGPTDEIVGELYSISANYRYWSEEMYPKTREIRRAGLHKDRALFVLSQLNEFMGDRQFRVLEIGAGTGDSMSVLKENSSVMLDCYVIEPNPSMEKLLIQNGVSVVGDSEDLEKESFDTLIAYEVLEHILNPKLFLAAYSELLKPGGLFIISTPNAHSLEVQQLKGNSTTLDIEHISVLTPAAIHSLAGKCNFKVLRIETPGEFDLEMIAQAKSSGNTEGKSISNQISQDQIKEFGFSSHMKVVLRKST